MRFYILITGLFFFIISSAQNYSNPLSAENKAKENEFLSSIAKYKEEGNTNLVAAFYNKLGYLYWESGNSELSIENFNQSISYNQKIGNNNALKTLYNNLGLIYSDLGNYETALLNFRKSLSISESAKSKADIAAAKQNIGLTLSTINRNEEAIKYLEEALVIAKELSDLKLLRSCYGLLYDNYQKIGNSEKSSEYFSLYSSFNNKIQKDESNLKEVESKKKIEHITEQKNLVENEKIKTEEVLKKTEQSLEVSEELNRQKQLEIELKELTVKEQEALLKAQKTFIVSVFVFAILLAILAFIIFRSYKHKKAANEKLELAFSQINKQNEDIQKSMNYAHRIQEALLPRVESIKKFADESFVFFRPREVVSGDFYFFAETPGSEKADISKKKEIDDFIVGAIDCTGHGVPGAFMSMIGYNMLSEIINKGVVETNDILVEMHHGIRTALKQDKTQNKDGMDVALCRIRKKENLLEFSGAINPLIYIQDHQLYQIRGDREGIGGTQKEEDRVYQKHSIKITVPTTCYIFSDGFADQFGGAEGSKFMIKLFKDLLLDIHEKPMSDQHSYLSAKLDEWMGDKYPQIDDILVIGFRVFPT